MNWFLEGVVMLVIFTLTSIAAMLCIGFWVALFKCVVKAFKGEDSNEKQES